MQSSSPLWALPPSPKVPWDFCFPCSLSLLTWLCEVGYENCEGCAGGSGCPSSWRQHCLGLSRCPCATPTFPNTPSGRRVSCGLLPAKPIVPADLSTMFRYSWQDSCPGVFFCSSRDGTGSGPGGNSGGKTASLISSF